MKRMAQAAAVFASLALGTPANADIITAGPFSDHLDFSAATGAESLTGPLPNLGNVGTSVTLGNATLTAGNTIFVDEGWSTLIPGGTAIAISGNENLDISINTGLATSFGFYFHEPSGSEDKLDGCNATCFNSTFVMEFFLRGSLIDESESFLSFDAPNNELRFIGIAFDEVFDEVRITETSGGIDNEFYGEMYATTVPTPGTLLLLGGGLLGLAAARRRRGH